MDKHELRIAPIQLSERPGDDLANFPVVFVYCPCGWVIPTTTDPRAKTRGAQIDGWAKGISELFAAHIVNA